MSTIFLLPNKEMQSFGILFQHDLSIGFVLWVNSRLKMEQTMFEKKLEDVFMSYLKKIPEDLKLGEEREVTCVCGGKLFVSKSKLNGHIHMVCNKCKFQIMQ